MDVNAQVAELNSHIKRFGDMTSGFRSEIGDVKAEVRELAQRVVGMGGGDNPIRSSGGPGFAARFQSAVDGHAGFEHIRAWNQGSARVAMDGTSIKAHLTNDGRGNSNDTTYPTYSERGGAYAGPFRPLRLLDVLPSREAHSDAVEFVRLSASGQADYQQREGDGKAEVSLSGDLGKTHIVTIAAWASASRQVLSDNNQLSGLVDGILRSLLLDRLEHALINGAGNGTNSDEIAGLLHNGTTVTNLQSTGLVDQIGEAIQRQRGHGYAPSAIVMNPADWHTHVATQRATPNGEYLFGSPTSPVPASLWGLPVVQTSSLDVGHALTLDTSRITLLDRQTPTVLVSNSHADFFTRNLLAMLAELRVGLEILDEGSIFIIEPTSGA